MSTKVRLKGGKMKENDYGYDDLNYRAIMLQEERTLRELHELKDKLNAILTTGINRSDIPEWLTIEQCASLKGLNINTLKCNAWLRPGEGARGMQRYCGGRLVFNRDEVVLPWLSVTDDMLESYLTETCGYRVIPEVILRKIRKAKEKTGGA